MVRNYQYLLIKNNIYIIMIIYISIYHWWWMKFMTLHYFTRNRLKVTKKSRQFETTKLELTNC